MAREEHKDFERNGHKLRIDKCLLRRHLRAGDSLTRIICRRKI